MSVGGDIDILHGEQVEIDVAVDLAAGASDVEIPAAEWKILRLVRIHHEWRGRVQKSKNAVAPAPGFSFAIELFERRGVRLAVLQVPDFTSVRGELR